MIPVTTKERELIFKLAEKLTGCNTDMRRDIFVQNVVRRATFRKAASIRDYLVQIRQDEKELSHLVSALTIHTTAWFREEAHYIWIEDYLRKSASGAVKPTVNVLSAGCSTAQELYSTGLVLELLRREEVISEYRLEGWDIDLIVLRKAAQCSYPLADKEAIPTRFQSLLETEPSPLQSGPPTFTLDRNVIERTTFRCVNLTAFDKEIENSFDLVLCRNVLIYFRPKQVDTIVRHLSALLKGDGHLILGHGEGVRAGDFDLLPAGPTVYGKKGPKSTTVNHSVSMKATHHNGRVPAAILIGASTGGPEALAALLKDMPASSPPVIVVQHISADFMGSLGRHLSVSSGLGLVSVKDTVVLEQNKLYMTIGDCHLILKEKNGQLCIGVSHVAPRNGHRPSIDELFHSAVPFAPHLVAMLLTGMGKDGAEGLLRLREGGALTMAQNEKSSVVYGMPREAVLMGAAMIIGTPQDLRAKLDDFLGRHFKHAKELAALVPSA